MENPAFSPDGKLVEAGTYADGTLSLIEVATGKLLSQVQVSMFGCGSLAFSDPRIGQSRAHARGSDRKLWP